MLRNARALHYVLKVGNLRKNIEFFRDKLGMKVLRHEVFEKGCEAACNGPYDGKWSKTMIGYGPEDDHFVLELTYNYSIGSYKLGNDLQHIKIALSEDKFLKFADMDFKDGQIDLSSPDGYKFILTKLSRGSQKSDVSEVCLACKNLEQSTEYWSGLLNMQRREGSNTGEVLLRYSETQADLRLRQIDEPVEHGTAYGRIAFSCPKADLMPLQEEMTKSKRTILTPYVELETPGKASVVVVILADPDGHEICFVGDEGFRELSQVDPAANDLIEKSMAEDKSEEWFQKKGLEKSQA